MFGGEKRLIKKILAIVLLLFLVNSMGITFLLGFKSEIEQKKTRNEEARAFITACHAKFEDRNYGLLLDSVVNRGLDDPAAQLIYGFILTNGYGVAKDPASGWNYYLKAYESGEPDAESCLVISAIKNFNDQRVVATFRKAYEANNSVATSYLIHLLAVQRDNYSNYNEISILKLPDDELLSFLTFEQSKWISTTKEYLVSVGTSSTPTFTRRFLYSNGEKRVYKETIMIEPERFPEFLVENPWGASSKHFPSEAN